VYQTLFTNNGFEIIHVFFSELSFCFISQLLSLQVFMLYLLKVVVTNVTWEFINCICSFAFFGAVKTSTVEDGENGCSWCDSCSEYESS
jgi:hypothetical protein